MLHVDKREESWKRLAEGGEWNLENRKWLKKHGNWRASGRKRKFQCNPLEATARKCIRKAATGPTSFVPDMSPCRPMFFSQTGC
jgi:hypothetical protein